MILLGSILLLARFLAPVEPYLSASIVIGVVIVGSGVAFWTLYLPY